MGGEQVSSRLLQRFLTRGGTREEFEQRVQRVFTRFIIKQQFGSFELLKTLSSVTPTQDAIQAGCVGLFHKGGANYYPLHSFAESQEIYYTLSPEEVQAEYTRLADLGLTHLIVDLKGFSGVTPSNEIMQESYRNDLTEGSVDQVIEAATAIDIPIDPQTIHDVYVEIFRRGVHCQYYAGQLESNLGQAPDLSEQEKQEIYLYHVQKGDLSDFDTVQEALGSEPCLPPLPMQEIYETCAKKGNFEYIKKCQDRFDVEPAFSPEVAQRISIHHIQEGNLNHLVALWEMVKDKPLIPGWIVQQKYAHYLRKGKLKKFYTLQELTRIEPHERVYDSFIEGVLE